MVEIIIMIDVKYSKIKQIKRPLQGFYLRVNAETQSDVSLVNVSMFCLLFRLSVCLGFDAFSDKCKKYFVGYHWLHFPSCLCRFGG